MNAGVILDAADAVLLDVDGVVCLGDEPVAGARDAVRSLRERVGVLVVTTNDSRRSRAAQEQRLARAGADGLPIVTAVNALAATLLGGGHRIVAACGTRAFSSELERLGLVVDPARATAVAIGAGAPAAAVAEARELLAAGVPAFAANADPVVPTPDGPVPDTGAVIAGLGCAPVVCGKPNEPMTRFVRPLLTGIAREKIVVVGDGVATDLAWARAEGWRAIFVGADGHADAAASVPALSALARAAR